MQKRTTAAATCSALLSHPCLHIELPVAGLLGRLADAKTPPPKQPNSQQDVTDYSSVSKKSKGSRTLRREPEQGATGRASGQYRRKGSSSDFSILLTCSPHRQSSNVKGPSCKKWGRLQLRVRKARALTRPHLAPRQSAPSQPPRQARGLKATVSGPYCWLSAPRSQLSVVQRVRVVTSCAGSDLSKAPQDCRTAINQCTASPSTA